MAEVKSAKVGGLEGPLLVQLRVFNDARGFFVERFHRREFEVAGLPTNFVQDNHSRTRPGVVRGMHFQHSPAQGKLVGVAHGRVWDVIVDVRAKSPTFGQHYGCELSDENGRMIWVPAGFAHGFCVLGEEPADVIYKVTEFYDAKKEGGIHCLDRDLAISWPLEKPDLSERDQSLGSFRDYRQSPVF